MHAFRGRRADNGKNVKGTGIYYDEVFESMSVIRRGKSIEIIPESLEVWLEEQWFSIKYVTESVCG